MNKEFADLENLSDLQIDPQAARRPDGFTNVVRGERQTFTDRCDKCRGTGRFFGFSGRDFGPCFKCNGKGTIDYKSSPTERAEKRRRATEGRANQLNAFIEAHPAQVAWLNEHSERNDFARSLLEKLTKYRSLTDPQIAAIDKAIVRDAERAAQKQTAIDNAKSVDVSKIEQAFATCRENAKKKGAEGVKWPKLRLDEFVFTDAPASGQFEAAILVKHQNATKLGRIQGGKFIRSFACDDVTEAAIAAAVKDPAAAAVAYGLKYSHCSICGLELTNEESIQRGIGPICAAKFGF